MKVEIKAKAHVEGRIALKPWAPWDIPMQDLYLGDLRVDLPDLPEIPNIPEIPMVKSDLFKIPRIKVFTSEYLPKDVIIGVDGDHYLLVKTEPTGTISVIAEGELPKVKFKTEEGSYARGN